MKVGRVALARDGRIREVIANNETVDCTLHGEQDQRFWFHHTDLPKHSFDNSVG